MESRLHQVLLNTDIREGNTVTSPRQNKSIFFNVLFTVHLSIILATGQLKAKILVL